jgi:hypothetical protein
MPQVLAVCDHCGYFFPSGTGVDTGGTGITLTLEVESAPRICPNCGRTAHILGGAYHIAEDTIELLQGPKRTVSELEQLREILRSAKERSAPVEEVQTALRREFPEWGSTLAKLLVPKTPAELYALVAVILMALDMILGAKQTGQTTNIEADQVINNITVEQAPPNPGQPPVVPSTESASPNLETVRKGKGVSSRNDPCWCGSGKKYKKCCGDPAK